jgi:ferredoxin, 2Fe-2S
MADTEFDLELADGHFLVRDREGQLHHLPGMDGFSLMEILRDFGLPVPALCGGACACGTCHVLIEAADFSRLPAAREDELERLDTLVYAQPLSRLACQILWDRAAMDGLNLTLAPLEA